MPKLRNSVALIVDVEMSCWNTPAPPEGMRSEIIEIGLVEINTENLEITREGSWLVRPAKSDISEYCTQLTGITPEEIKRQGRPWSEVIRSVAKEFGPARKSLMAWGNDWLDIEADCLAAGCVNPFPREAFLNIGKVASFLHGGNGNLGLDKARSLLNLPVPDNRHRALPDARATAELFMEMSRISRAFLMREEPDAEAHRVSAILTSLG